MEPKSAPARLRRSLFFVPGIDPRKLEKSVELGADTLLFDLEDSVGVPEKDQARTLLADFIPHIDRTRTELAIRVNPPGTPFFEEDLAAALAVGVDAIMCPKSEEATVLRDLATRIENAEASPSHNKSTDTAETTSATQVLALVETAQGILNLNSVASANNRIAALCFGHADFSQNMGLSKPDPSSGVVLHARCSVAIAARAHDLSPVDTVYLDVRNQDGFRADATFGMQLGFAGKLCIHPSQVQITHDVYTPSEEEIAHALRVIDAQKEAEASGLGVFTVDGKMVDAPLIAAQLQVLERARKAGALND